MVDKNSNLSRLAPSYLFSQIEQKKAAFLKRHPEVELINLGIGDTTSPLPQPIAKRMADASLQLATAEGYRGYGPVAGEPRLREKISDVIYENRVARDEVFVSDGSKCDIGRLQTLFGQNVSIAVQDPTYPVYVDGTLLLGGGHPVVALPCVPENDFFPDLSQVPCTDLIYFCSPNNPTGSVATHPQLKELVRFAKQNGSIIIYDSAYSAFIQDAHLPRSIYEVEGAEEVAIETGSFSKMAGFTGLRLGWTVVPKALKFSDGGSLRDAWIRTISTIYNGPSNIVQAGGLAALDKEGQKAVEQLIQRYMTGANRLRSALDGYEVYGGVNSPYLWVRYPGRDSWSSFHQLLEQSHIISTPGSGFGPSGEGFVRFSAFANPGTIEKAIHHLTSRAQSFV